MLGFFWEKYQQGKIGEAHSAAESARDQSARGIRELEARLESLTLTTMAMWSLLAEKHGVSEAELAERVRELDLRDGQLDGKSRAPLVACLECGRKFSSARERCIYCGGIPNLGAATGLTASAPPGVPHGCGSRARPSSRWAPRRARVRTGLVPSDSEQTRPQ
ncbi:MAG: hypothetical protein WD749_05610 [Phycisphaerales bacterium]